MKKKKVFLGLSLIACGIAIASCGKKAAKDNSNDNNVVKDPDGQTEGQNTQKYTVNWVVDGQTIKTESLDKDASINAPSNPTKSSTIQHNFTFDGWYTAETGGTKVTNFGLVSQDVTYYGRFTENLNQYTYKFFNGNVELKSETVDYGSNIIAPENPTKDATDNKVFYFDGWYTQAEGGEKVTTFATVTGDVSFYARFTEEEKYTYSFVNANGSTVKTDNIKAGEEIVAPTENPTLASTDEFEYTFDGWYTAAEGGEKVTTFGNISGDVTYYAHYNSTKREYTYTLYNEDGSVYGTDTLKYGEIFDAPELEKTSTAEYTYTFEGWYTQAEGGEKVTDFTIKGETKLYARFSSVKNEYTYTFYDENGQSLKTATIKYGGAIVAPEANPTKTATAEYTYTFDGWYTEATGGEKVTEFGKISSNVSYYAQFNGVKNEYTYTFYDANGQPLKTATIKYGEAIVAPTTNPTKTATAEYTYTFEGWYTEATGGEKVTEFGTISSNVSYYAQFNGVKNEYTYTFYDANGNAFKTETIKYGSAIVAPTTNPTKAATAEYTYTFEGWYTQAEGGVKVESFGNIVSNVSYYPQFTSVKNQYTYVLYNEDGSVYETKTIDYGTEMSHPDLVKETTAEYTYGFEGWFTKNGSKIFSFIINEENFDLSNDIELYARFFGYKRKYTYIFYDDNSNIIKSVNDYYGTQIEAPEDPSKTATAEYTYTFDGWYTLAGEKVTEFGTITGEARYYAKFNGIKNKYKYTFISEGVEISSNTIDYGTNIPVPANPTKEAEGLTTYTFIGWYTEAIGGEKVTDFSSITGNVTYYAHFDSETGVERYTYTFYNYDGSVYKTDIITADEVVVKPTTNPTKPNDNYYHYEFDGWYTAAEGGEKVTEFGTITENTSYYARFYNLVTKYQVVFYGPNGIAKAVNANYEEVVTPPTVSKENTAQYTYEFDGWYTAAEGGEKVTDFTITSVVSFYAHFTETVNQYTYKFIFDSFENPYYEATINYGEAIVPPSVNPSMDPTAEYTYEFAGWYTEVMGGEKVTDFGTITGNVTYYARFTGTKNQYTYTFYDENGTEISSKTTSYGDTAEVPTVTKDNTVEYTYTFDGWYTAPSGGEKVTSFVVTGNAAYYARFTSVKNQYTYTFYDENGNVISTDTIDYGTAIQKPADPTKAATAEYTYTFDGWYTAQTSGTKVTDFSAITGNVTYYAQFIETINQYTYTFYNEDGSVNTTSIVNYGTAIQKPADPTKASTAEYEYTFDGWYTAAEGGEKVTTFGSITGNVSYYARFNSIAKSSSDPEQQESVGFGENYTPWADLFAYTGSTRKDSKGRTKLGATSDTETVTMNGFTFLGKAVFESNIFNTQGSTITIQVSKNGTSINMSAKWASDDVGVLRVTKNGTQIYESDTYAKNDAVLLSLSDLDAGTYIIKADKTSTTGSASLQVSTVYYSRVVENVTVTYVTEHGSVPSVTFEKGSTIDELPELYADGYVFEGWYTDANRTDPFIQTTAITQNTTLYARWKVYSADDYVTVTFNTGVADAMNPRTIEKGSKITDLPELEVVGYRFDGWFTDASFEHAFNSNLAITANTTLYAKFIKVYDVSFKYEDSSSVIKTIQVDENGYIESFDIPEAEYKYGYTFAYWANGTEEFNFDTTKVTSNLTLVAKYTQAENTGKVNITTCVGDLEALYAEFIAYDNATEYSAYVKLSSSSTYVKQDPQLIRLYQGNNYTYYRFDAVGLKAGTYDLKIVPIVNGNEVASAASEKNNVVVKAHDRSGFGFVNGSSSGAYNDDGTLKSNAQVVYVSNSNKDTVTLTALDKKGVSTTLVGVQNIITNMKDNTKTAPLCIRVLGNITDPANMPNGDLYIDGSVNGLTVEGIGTDATMNGFGIVIKNSSNVEIRNLGFMNCNSSEGDDCGLQQKNDHCWVHNCDFFYGDAGSAADQAKGDGALDTKTSTYITHSYNHFWDNGKCNLQGMKSETTSNYITYHHNWYDHSDSRHPRIRTCTVHIYNNYFDGNSKYGVGVTLGASAFVENNYFRSTATMKPMMSSMQGTDALGDGTFSGENGGIIKAYNNTFDGNVSYIPYSQNNTSFDAYEVSSRNETVPSSVKTVAGGTTYNNFDTASTMYSYTAESPADAKATVTQYAGRVQGGDFKWTFPNSEDSNYAVITALKSALTNYSSKLLSVQSIGEQSSGGQGGNTDPTPTETSVNDVIAMIDALPTPSAVVESDRTAIMAAKSAFDSLSSADQANVTNSTKLSQCIAALPEVTSFTIDYLTTSVSTGSNVTIYNSNNILITTDKIAAYDSTRGVKFNSGYGFTIKNNSSSTKSFAVTVVGNGGNKSFTYDSGTVSFGTTAQTVNITIAAGASVTFTTSTGGAFLQRIVVS